MRVAERIGALDRRSRCRRAIGEPAVRGDHADRVRLGICTQPADDLVVGGVGLRLAARARSRSPSSGSAARAALEHDDDVLALGGGPALEQVDEAEHRGVPIAPPAVGTRADHVHAVDDPAHRLERSGSRYSSCCAGLRRARLRSPGGASIPGAAAGRPSSASVACRGRWTVERGASADGAGARARARGCGSGCARPARPRSRAARAARSAGASARRSASARGCDVERGLDPRRGDVRMLSPGSR